MARPASAVAAWRQQAAPGITAADAPARTGRIGLPGPEASNTRKQHRRGTCFGPAPPRYRLAEESQRPGSRDGFSQPSNVDNTIGVAVTLPTSTTRTMRQVCGGGGGWAGSGGGPMSEAKAATSTLLAFRGEVCRGPGSARSHRLGGCVPVRRLSTRHGRNVARQPHVRRRRQPGSARVRRRSAIYRRRAPYESHTQQERRRRHRLRTGEVPTFILPGGSRRCCSGC